MKEREEARTREEKEKKKGLAKERNFKHRPGARIFFFILPFARQTEGGVESDQIIQYKVFPFVY
jgi:hypothetical protein